MESAPQLIEPGAKYFLKHTLEHCKNFKDKYFNSLFNIGLVIGFLIIVFLILYFRFKGNIKPEEKKLKQKREKEYIMTKLIQLSDYKRKKSQNLITNLPDWSNNPESIILNRKLY
tara:strand:+ start:505 stop:849 length:345 start_codon:yes stop_codon:yes gene_type:complete